MEFTTHLGLHSQATRLFERGPYSRDSQGTDGVVTLYDSTFQKNSPWALLGTPSIDYNSGPNPIGPDFQVELFPLHSPLLRESWLVSFPPLSYMLKFRGSSYLISGQLVNYKWVGRTQGPQRATILATA